MNERETPNAGFPANQEQSIVEGDDQLDQVTDGAPTTGRRLALTQLRRELSDEDLKSPGVQKMLLDELERADAECETFRAYAPLYHEADKRAAVLEERVRTHTALEIMFGIGVGIGGTLVGAAPALWDTPPQGVLSLGIGLVLILGAAVARVVKR